MKKVLTSLALVSTCLYASVALSNSESENANNVYQQAVNLVSVGKGMESLRGSTNVDENQQCSQTMKSSMPKVDALRAQADTLAVSNFQLKLAAIELYSCVTCATDALESCARADDALKEFSNKG